jgi:hypothetical protein
MIWSVFGRVHDWDNWDNWDNADRTHGNYIKQDFLSCTAVKDDVHESE